MARIPKKKEVTYRKYNETKLILPQVAFLYKLKRTYWLLHNVHRKLQDDPTAIPYRQYKEMLEDYTKMVEDSQKLGMYTAKGRKDVRKRVVEQGMAEIGEPDATADLGESNPFGLGS